MIKHWLKVLFITILISSVIYWLLIFAVWYYVWVFKDWIFSFFVTQGELIWFFYMIIFILCYMVVDMFLPR